ncbi:MAG: amidohydrolase family protein [Candidatus Latescibacteria bacterium]|nr:amidohydrolase family protein [Candidatus Latescibacterota bacterium]
MSTPAQQPIRMCDPHFHLWDLPNRPNPNFGDPAEHPLPSYLGTDYDRDMAQLPAPLQLVSSVFVETVVGQKPGGAPIDAVDESRWICSQMQPRESERPFYLVPYVHLARDTAAAASAIEQHADIAQGRLRGVRMILNHHPSDPELTWPQVESGDLLRNPLMREGLGLLQERGLAFDLSCHPHQVDDAVAVLDQIPELRVAINHLGFLHDGEDQAHEEQWRRSIKALANLPNTHMKLSMLWFGRQGYHSDADKEAKVRDLVLETIDTFGCQRCMFASNYPVDKFMGIDIPTLYGKFLDWSAHLSAAQRADLFHDTAVKAYQL